MTEITPASLELFLSLAEDAGDWSGTPLVEVTPAERGNLTHLKKLGLLSTYEDEDGCVFAAFSDAGIELARRHGIDTAAMKDGREWFNPEVQS